MQIFAILTMNCSRAVWFEAYLGPELQCLLKIKEDLGQVLIFQHAILDAK